MDQDRLTASLRDELGLAIEAAVAVTPAPSLKAQVRARVEHERTKPSRWIGFPLAALGACALVIAAVVLASWVRDREHMAAAPVLTATHITTLQPYAVAEAPSLLLISRPEVPGHATPLQTSLRRGLSPDAIALRSYVDYLRQLRVDTAERAAVRPATEPLELPAIVIERIAIDPLPKLDAVTGERQ